MHLQLGLPALGELGLQPGVLVSAPGPGAAHIEPHAPPACH